MVSSLRIEGEGVAPEPARDSVRRVNRVARRDDVEVGRYSPGCEVTYSAADEVGGGDDAPQTGEESSERCRDFGFG